MKPSSTGNSGYSPKNTAIATGTPRNSTANSAHNWARRRGAENMILNTKPENMGALILYQSEGYMVLPERLQLLRYPADQS